MQGPIMQAKILVDVVGVNTPALRIYQGSGLEPSNWSSLSLADKVLSNLFKQRDPGEVIFLRVENCTAPDVVKVITRSTGMDTFDEIVEVHLNRCKTADQTARLKDAALELRSAMNEVFLSHDVGGVTYGHENDSENSLGKLLDRY